MTREERLELLKQIEKDIYVPSIESTFLDDAKSCAIHSIIEELEQESCEDAISRKAALKIYDEWFATCNIADKKESPKSKIKALPPVTSQPKTGHWIRELIRNEKGGCIGAKMICSKCDNDNKHDEYMKFCPNCGEKMIEPQESEVNE